MTAPIIDRGAIIEKAMQAVWGVEDGDPTPWQAAMAASEGTRATIRAALPSIADDLLAPIEALHQPNPTLEYLPNGVRIPWRACSCGFRAHSACPTAQAVAAIRKAVRA